MSAPATTGDPERDAQNLLDTVWSLGGFGIKLPVDPFYIADELGLRVLVASLDPDVSGMLVQRLGQDGAIYLQQSDSRNRRRFTCAHELGHYVRSDGREVEKVEHRALLASQGVDREEIYANQFAAALLMPAAEVKERWAPWVQVATMAYDFGVSADAMNFRVVNLGLKPR